MLATGLLILVATVVLEEMGHHRMADGLFYFGLAVLLLAITRHLT